MTKNLPASGAESITTLIAKAAYYKAEQRGFAPGHEEEDWLAAEREVRAGFETDTAVLPGPKVHTTRSRIRSAIGKISTSSKKKKA